MIEPVKGNLLKADTEAIVNTVNTRGVMGKGIALQFKQAFPAMFNEYESACKAGEVRIGRMHVYANPEFFGPRYIINFPTKEDWRSPSRPEFIQKGLADLVRIIREYKIKSIAIPPLGCGNGGLEWSLVRGMIYQAFSDIQDVRVLVFEPAGAPDAADMKSNSPKPDMNISRAIVLKLLQRYRILGYDLTLLEIHKLLYFLQAFGEPLRLNYKKHVYGPYADNLRHVLLLFENHYLQGFGDGTRNRPDTKIRILDGAVDAVDNFFHTSKEETGLHLERLKRVEDLIEGFESPYGLELLSTIHWLIEHENINPANDDMVISAVYAWNPRKKKIMKPEHIKTALHRIVQSGVLKLAS